MLTCSTDLGDDLPDSSRHHTRIAMRGLDGDLCRPHSRCLFWSSLATSNVLLKLYNVLKFHVLTLGLICKFAAVSQVLDRAVTYFARPSQNHSRTPEC